MPSVREWDVGKVQDAASSDVRENSHEERKKRDDERRVRKEKRSPTPSQEGPGKYCFILC